MELSITEATGFFGSQFAQERGGRDTRVNPVAPGAASIVTTDWDVLGRAREAAGEWTEQTATEKPLKHLRNRRESRPSRGSLPRTTPRTLPL